MIFNDTIAAVSTPRGKGGIAVIRISGAEALEIAEKIFVLANGKSLREVGASRAVYGKIYADESRDCLPVDDGIATVFLAPRSFTAEDTVEISCHGGILSTEAVLSAILRAGARHAEAGEFTRRAFVNGRMGLAEAEALSNLLEAKNYSQLKLARSGLEGKLAKKCGEIYDGLGFILASLYAKIDYPDEDLAEVGREEMTETVRRALENLKKLAATYKSGHAVAEGVKTVICGRPNVGKSSIYNAVVGRNAAIVTDVEGTTRDVLEETASLGGVTLRLCDTAGLRPSEDRVEMIGIERAYEKLDEAELILAVFDGSSELTKEDEELFSCLADKKELVIAVVNKSELERKADMDKIAREFGGVIEVSAQSEDGIAPLAKAVSEKFLDSELDVERDAVVFGARQHAALEKASDRLMQALELIEGGFEIDAAAFAVEDAMGALAELDGRQVGDDIVAEIFANFCVGK